MKHKIVVDALTAIVVFVMFNGCTGGRENAGCGVQQKRVAEAQKVVQIPDKSNYFERRQIAEAETMNDRPGKVYFWYILSSEGKLVQCFTCVGRPASSTESLEPNQIYTTSGMTYGFEVPLEGDQSAYTSEAMGIDGTFGEPVPFRYCITPEGHYVDVSMFQNSIVSSMPLQFEQTLARFDAELEAKKLIAEKTLKEGGCIDSNLNPIPCSEVEKNIKE